MSQLIRRLYDRRHRMPLLGLAGSTALCLVLIHVWFAGWTARLLQLPLPLAYACLAVFLVLLQSWRLAQILRNRDTVTNWLNRHVETTDATGEGDDDDQPQEE